MEPAPKKFRTLLLGAAMYPGKNIVENAMNSADHTTLVAAVVAAGLTEPLSSPGSFTLFAPVNDAFAALPAGTVDTLLLPENKDTLTKVLTAHAVAGDLKAADLIALAAANGGTATLTTVSGDTLTFAVDGGAAIAPMKTAAMPPSPPPMSTSRTASSTSSTRYSCRTEPVRPTAGALIPRVTGRTTRGSGQPLPHFRSQTGPLPPPSPLAAKCQPATLLPKRRNRHAQAIL